MGGRASQEGNVECAKTLSLRVHVHAEPSTEDRTFYLLCLLFGFHAKDVLKSLNGLESGNDLVSGSDVMGLTSLLRSD